MLSTCNLTRRLVHPEQASFLSQAYPTFTPLELRLYAQRGVDSAPKMLPDWLKLGMMDLERGAQCIEEAIEKKRPLTVVADYDCDGATACAVMVGGLRALGANIEFVVPDRMVHGYGISPSVVDLALERYPKTEVLVTVDNGILGHSGIDYANGLGLDVVVTDHHLPGATLPDAVAVINPSRQDCGSGLARLAGVGVALWLVAAVKRRQAARGLTTPPLNFLLPYVAIGTVADMVSLGPENRQLVATGLERMRLGQAPVGVTALMKEAGCVPAYMTTQDIGFGLGPRINAAGRLDSMDLGIELLLSQDPRKAAQLARLLSETNEERKRLQKEATTEASVSVDFALSPDARSIVRGDAAWHPGVVGLVASRIKDTYYLPTFVFSLADGYAKGSGRSIPGFHLKDALEEVARRAPGLLAKFGGHAMAAGATLTGVEALEPFAKAFEDVARERVSEAMLNRTLMSDGPMPDLELVDAARMLRHPWGQGFEPPAFDDAARIEAVRPLGSSGEHWKIQARIAGRQSPTTVVLFNQEQPSVGQEVQLYLQPGLNTWKDTTCLQWLGKVLN